MNIDQVMTRDVITLRPEQSIAEAVREMASRGISGAPVVDGGKLVGIITEKDILRAIRDRARKLQMVYPSLSTVSVWFVEKLDSKEAEEIFAEIADAPVSRYMTRDVITVQAGTHLAEVVGIILKHGVNRIPVMAGDRLVGIVSRADIIRGLAQSGALEGGD